jgi:hypothetical protein
VKYFILILALVSASAFAESPSGGGGGGFKPSSGGGFDNAPKGAPNSKAGNGSGGAPDATANAGADSGASTDSATSPPPEFYADKFGKNWSATKQNEDMLKDPALVDEATKDGNLSQEDSYTLVSNTLYGCVEVAASGRDDGACKTDPNHPECAGVARALANATNCLEYFTPATLGCKRYGTAEYSLEEWIAVGDQFQAQMVSCAERKKIFEDKKLDLKLGSLTQNIGAANYKTSIPGGPSLAGMLLAPQSNVSGEIKPDITVEALDWSELSTKVKDGASYLGYHEGDIIRASLKGETFSSIVTESPFAKDLNIENRAKLDEGLSDSKMIANRVIQTYQENGGQSLAENDTASGSNGQEQPGELRVNLNQPAFGSEAYGNTAAGQGAPANATGGAVAPGGNGKAEAADAAEAHKMLEAERIEAVAKAAAIYRAESKPYRTPASIVQAKVEDLFDTTLFHRVSQAYRRKSAGMKTFDSRSGDLIRSIERPEIFRNL